MTRAQTTRSPERARRLSTDTILQVGLKLAASADDNPISFRALGSALGVDPTAIYRHFRSKDELMRALLDRVHLLVLDRLTGVGDWAERIETLAWVTLDVHIAHPAIAIEALTLTTNGVGEARTIEYILEAFSDAGLERGEVVRHYALMASFMLAQTASIARARQHRNPTHRRDPLPWLEGALQIDPREQHRVAELSLELTSLMDDDLYELGIRSVIESARRHTVR